MTKNIIPDNRKKLIAMRTRRAGLEKDRQPWTDSDLGLLQEDFVAGKGISEIALILQRTELAVFQKAKDMDLFASETSPRGPNCKENCQCDKCTDAISCMYYHQKLEDEAAAEQEDSGKKRNRRDKVPVRRCSFRPEAN